MRPYSQDLRDRVVAACDAGELTREEIAEEFDVSTSWIRRLLQRRREEGHYGAKQGKRGRKPVIVGQSLTQLDQLVEERPDATLEELRDHTSASCSLVTISNTLKRLGYRRKKRLSRAAEQDRPDVKEKRCAWIRKTRRMDPSRFVFIDESGAKTNMNPTPRTLQRW